eukprot:CAMPEP_0118837916 /NCGR_PEP_ID=MMETSP1162-20130426/64263_1 /TAXON_ID=33656 /ORGANISM="Phaeocystis Sp, Strain CCMP2710" /LENGTH=50 /DNA_ID=CAMNT_0006769823 /DNA_START=1 /DNA_END=150 /DNA_ORIENTATION=-
MCPRLQPYVLVPASTGTRPRMGQRCPPGRGGCAMERCARGTCALERCALE